MSWPVYGMMALLALFIAPPAFAQAASGAQPPLMIQLLPFAVMFGVMYFLMIRPQMKKQKQHQEFISKLSRGDEVITSSGIFGTVEGLTDTAVTLEIASDVRIKVLRSSIAGSARATVAAASEVKA
jgi:preprotein translocase subunit YajC